MLRQIAIGKCALCGAEVTEVNFCYGCGHFVCDDCAGSVDSTPVGRDHALEEHIKAVLADYPKGAIA